MCPCYLCLVRPLVLPQALKPRCSAELINQVSHSQTSQVCKLLWWFPSATNATPSRVADGWPGLLILVEALGLGLELHIRALQFSPDRVASACPTWSMGARPSGLNLSNLVLQSRATWTQTLV